MSFVYLATDTMTGERRAMKVLSPSLSRDQNAVARLGREAELAGRVRHPNVCHIEHIGHTLDGLVYVVMPFLDGEILADRTYRLGQIPLDEAVVYVADIAAGLQAAHDQQIVHRDLKPENVMIIRGANGMDHATVMDFGLAKERRAGPELERLTATGIVLGTPEFMSPEQLRGKTLDGRSDVIRPHFGRNAHGHVAIRRQVTAGADVSPDCATNLLQYGESGPTSRSPRLSNGFSSRPCREIPMIDMPRRRHLLRQCRRQVGRVRWAVLHRC